MIFRYEVNSVVIERLSLGSGVKFGKTLFVEIVDEISSHSDGLS